MTTNRKEKRKILYIIGIDWSWIYQRPQILAERLAADYDVTVIFPRSVLKGLPRYPEKGRRPAFRRRILWTVPYQEKSTLIGAVSVFFQRFLFSHINQYDIVYIGYPLYARYIPDNYAGKLIYDCMDNHAALYSDHKRVDRLVSQERRLVRMCNSLIVSSAGLAKRMDAIAGWQKSVIIRNGVSLNKPDGIKCPTVKAGYRLGYIGTISEWFDFEVLQRSMEQVDGIEYHLIGPCAGGAVPRQFSYEGVVAHDRLGESIKDYDCLIMPFKVNDIVEDVDPVKLYEYISFGKCIISVYYKEIERFGDFVYFYTTGQEYVSLLRSLKEKGFPVKYTEEQRSCFLTENSWEARYAQLHAILEMGGEGEQD